MRQRRWTRRHGAHSDARAITYHREAAPMFWVLAGLVVIELSVVHLVMPWPVARLVLLVFTSTPCSCSLGSSPDGW